MSTHAVDVAVRLGLQDGATPGIDQAAARVQKAVGQTAAAVTASNAVQRSSFERTSHARELLGVRSETRIQREIAQTQAAYARLLAGGKLSAEEQARALEATTRRVTELTNEMGRLTAAQQRVNAEKQRQVQIDERIAKGQQALRVGGAVVAGTAAAAYTLREPVRQAMGFDERLGLLANTAYAEFDATGKKVGEAQMRAAVKRAVAEGMTVDGAVDALDKLIKDNQVGGVKGAMELLPFIAKSSVGSGSQPEAVAAMLGSLIGSGYAKDTDQAKRQMGMATAAATAGAFEKEDMSKHLPAILPLAKLAGLTGDQGLVKVLTLLQQARTTAGSSDEAANNVKNLLTKVASQDTANDFKKAGRGDLYKHLMDQRAKGVDPLTAWQNVIDKEISRNPNLKPAMAKLKAAKTPEEQQAAVDALKGMAEGQSIGKYFQDMQARSALFGLRDRGMEDKVAEAVNTLAPSIIANDAQYMQDKTGVKARVAGESVKLAQADALEGPLGVVGKAADAIAAMAQRFPAFTGGLTLATTGLVAAAGAAGLFTLAAGGGGGKSIFARLAGRFLPSATTVAAPAATAGAGAAAVGSGGVIGALAAKFARVFTPAAAGALAAPAATAGAGAAAVGSGGVIGALASKFLPRAIGAMKVGGVGSMAAGVGGMALDAVAGEDSAVSRYGGGVLNGAAMGATVGSLVPVVGTAIGAGVGALGGALVAWLQDNPAAVAQQGQTAQQVSPPPAPKMTGDIRISVTDDRVRVAGTKVSTEGMTGTLQVDATGSIWGSM